MIFVFIAFIATTVLILITGESVGIEEQLDLASDPPEATQTQIVQPPQTLSPSTEKNMEIAAVTAESPVYTPYELDETNPDYREAMRQWVIGIGTIARQFDSAFLLIPQNCGPLFTSTGEAGGEIVHEFLSALNGIGVEGVSFGNNRYNRARKASDRDGLVSLLDIAEQNGIEVLSVDYCSDEDKVQEALELNDNHGFISFFAEDFGLKDIPDNNLNINDNDILSLSDAKNWLYLINPEKYASKASYIKALSETNHDILVIDAFFEDEQMLTQADVAALQKKKNGSKRIVISYMSIGEAEDYRYYWKQEYDSSPPSWMLAENSRWEGNYTVKYWDENWQEIIATGDDSYLKRILDAGFNGVYLDIVDGYETFEEMD